MAEPWIKMRTDLYRDPKVAVIADQLMAPDSDLARFVSQNRQRDMTVTRNVMRNVTCGALLSVWGVMRLRGKRDGDDLLIQNASLSVIDDVADLPGFGEAMAVVGWAEEDASALVFPNFFESHNTDPSELAKAKNRERQQRYRAKQKGGNSNVTVTLRNAQRREEKSRESLVSKDTKDKGASRFKRPSLEDVSQFCRDESLDVDPSEFVDFYESNGWKVGRSAMKDWKATIRNWHRRRQKETRNGRHGTRRATGEGPPSTGSLLD